MQSDKLRQCYDQVFREQMEWILVGFVLLDLWFCFVEHCFFFVLVLLAIVLSVLLRFTPSDCPFISSNFYSFYFHKSVMTNVETSFQKH